MTDTQNDVAPDTDKSFSSLMIAAIFAGAIGAAFIFNSFFSSSPSTPAIHAGAGVMVFDISDWVTGIEIGASPEEIQARVQAARSAVNQAAQAGYIILNAESVSAFPDQARFTPAAYHALMEGDE